MSVYIRYLDFAENSCKVAKLVSKDPGILFGTALFYARECAEYALKAYLAFHKIRSSHISQLSELISMSVPFDKQFAELSEKAVKLNRYSEELTRYPSDEIIPRDVSNEQAIAFAEEFLAFVKERMELGNASVSSHHSRNTPEHTS